MTQTVGMIAILAMLDALVDRVETLEADNILLEGAVKCLETYVFQDVEPNILPDIKPVGRGLEEYPVGISGTDETI